MSLVAGTRVKWLDDEGNIQYGLFLSYLEHPWAKVECDSVDLIINRIRLFRVSGDLDGGNARDWSSDSES